jgi:ABC-type Fe3+-hydroxamate transport system substrate-binding protein
VRVVSLVPSATETLLALGVTPVACTRFCEQPGLLAVGGTKNPDVAAIVALEPDLVVMNDEENRREDFDALRDAGLTVYSMSPRGVDDVGPAVRALADAAGAALVPEARAAAWDARLDAVRRAVDAGDRVGTVTFVWRRPWMTLSATTYGSSLLDLVGFDNVFAAASDRYAEVTLEDVAARDPALVLLPSEPYAFAPRHRREIERGLPGCAVRFVDGRDLFWWGIRTPAAAARLSSSLR